MSKKKLHVWLAVGAAALGAAEALMHLWQPLLPPGVFAGIATVVGVGAKVAQVYLAAENLDIDGEDKEEPKDAE